MVGMPGQCWSPRSWSTVNNLPDDQDFQGIEGYRQLKHFKEPFKFWLLIILLIVTLLIVFAAIWFGLYISRGPHRTPGKAGAGHPPGRRWRPGI